MRLMIFGHTTLVPEISLLSSGQFLFSSSGQDINSRSGHIDQQPETLNDSRATFEPEPPTVPTSAAEAGEVVMVRRPGFPAAPARQIPWLTASAIAWLVFEEMALSREMFNTDLPIRPVFEATPIAYARYICKCLEPR